MWASRPNVDGCAALLRCYIETVTLPPSAGPRVRPLQIVLFVVSAAAVAASLHFAWEEPFVAAAGLLVGCIVLAVRWRSRRRARQLLQSGDVESILARWSSAFERVPHAGTMAPLMAATAFAAHGWVARAREILRGAERGPAWDAALEHRLFLDTILLTFEGQPEEALAQAAHLQSLPMPAAMPFMVERVRMLRSAVAALARAFAHRSQLGDRQIMLTASDASPLVHWAMRYGAAIMAVDGGDVGGARTLLSGAPTWPVESRFRDFHEEIAGELDRRGASELPPDLSAAEEGAAEAPRGDADASPEQVEPSDTQTLGGPRDQGHGS